MTCEGNDVLQESHKQSIKDWASQAAQFYASELSIQRETSIRFSSQTATQTCGGYGGFYIPSNYFDGSVTNSDLVSCCRCLAWLSAADALAQVIFVTAWTTPNKRSGSAWGLGCRFNRFGDPSCCKFVCLFVSRVVPLFSINRPVMGQINLLPHSISTSSNYYSIILHEITHVLGMSSQVGLRNIFIIGIFFPLHLSCASNKQTNKQTKSTTTNIIVETSVARARATKRSRTMSSLAKREKTSFYQSNIRFFCL